MEKSSKSQSRFFNTTTITVSDINQNVTHTNTSFSNRENSTNTTDINVPEIGQTSVNITDIINSNLSNYNLVINGTRIANGNAYNIIDNNDNDSQNSWLLENNGKIFALFRLDATTNQKSNNGTTLMIVPINPNDPTPEKYTDNAVFIDDFPFTQAFNEKNPFGLNLKYNTTNTLVLNDGLLGSGYTTISLEKDKGFLTYKKDANNNINWKAYDIFGSPVNNGTITNSVTENNSYITSPIIPLPSGNFLYISGKIDKDTVKKITHYPEELGGSKKDPATPPYYIEIYAQEFDSNGKPVGAKTIIAKGDFNELKQIASLSPDEMLVVYNKFKYQDNDIAKKQSLGTFSQTYNYNVSSNSTLPNTTDVMEVNKQPTNSTTPYTTYNSTLGEYTVYKSLNNATTNTTTITSKEHTDKKVVDKNGNIVSTGIISNGDLDIKNVTRVSNLPLLKVINVHSIDENTIYATAKNGINEFDIIGNGVNVRLEDFDSKHDVVVDSSSMANNSTNTTVPLNVTIIKEDGNTVATFNNNTITFKNPVNNITENAFVYAGKQGNVVLTDKGIISDDALVASVGKPIDFNQMTSRIKLDLKAVQDDILAHPNDKYKVEIFLHDKSNKPIKGLLITKGVTKDGKYRSNYDEKTGLWQIVENFNEYDDTSGTPAIVDAKTAIELLEGNEIHATPEFNPQDWQLKIHLENVNNISLSRDYDIKGNYKCVELSDDFLNSFTPESIKNNGTLVINFLNYVKNPKDPALYDATFNLMWAIDNGTLALTEESKAEFNQTIANQTGINITNSTNSTNSTLGNTTFYSTHLNTSSLINNTNSTTLSNDDVPFDINEMIKIQRINKTAFNVTGVDGTYRLKWQAIDKCNHMVEGAFNATMGNSQKDNDLGMGLGFGIGVPIVVGGGLGFLAYCYRNSIKACFINLRNRRSAGNQQPTGTGNQEGNNIVGNQDSQVPLQAEQVHVVSDLNQRNRPVYRANNQEEYKKVEEDPTKTIIDDAFNNRMTTTNKKNNPQVLKMEDLVMSESQVNSIKKKQKVPTYNTNYEDFSFGGMNNHKKQFNPSNSEYSNISEGKIIKNTNQYQVKNRKSNSSVVETYSLPSHSLKDDLEEMTLENKKDPSKKSSLKNASSSFNPTGAKSLRSSKIEHAHES